MGRVADDGGIVRHVFGDDSSGANHRVFSDSDTRKDDRACTDTCACFDMCFFTSPVAFEFDRSVFICCSRMRVISKCDVRADEDTVVYQYPFRYKHKWFNLASTSYGDALFYLDKCADFRLVADRAPEKIDELFVG